MKIKRIKEIRINATLFKIKWNEKVEWAGFDYVTKIMEIGTKDKERVFPMLCHELMEIMAIEMNIRFRRLDCSSEYLFSYDHRQFNTMMEMFTGALDQFIKE